jgi:hypothetical protein
VRSCTVRGVKPDAVGEIHRTPREGMDRVPLIRGRSDGEDLLRRTTLLRGFDLPGCRLCHVDAAQGRGDFLRRALMLPILYRRI